MVELEMCICWILEIKSAQAVTIRELDIDD